MNPWIPFLIGGGVICHLMLTAFYYGQLTRQVRDHDRRILAVEEEKFGERIARLEALKNGQTQMRAHS